MHFDCLQHLFSIACGIGLQRPQVHQSTKGLPGEGMGSAEESVTAMVIHVAPAVSVSAIVSPVSSVSSRSSSTLPTPLRKHVTANFCTIASSSVAMNSSNVYTVAQFRYIKIQPKTIDISTRARPRAASSSRTNNGHDVYSSSG